MGLTWPEHAARLWTMLTDAAKNRQTFTYKHVAERMGITPQGTAYPLGCIMNYCEAKGLPPLTVIVVATGTGKPGDGLLPSSDRDSDREKVYEFDWSGHPAPSAEALKPFTPRPVAGASKADSEHGTNTPPA